MTASSGPQALEPGLGIRLAMAARRVAAFMVDWLVIAAWGSLVFAVAWTTSGGDLARVSPWWGQAIGLVCMTLPVLLYFSCMESGARGATLGKRALGLSVRRLDGGRLRLAHALVRNVVKLAPWECGHVVAHQLFAAGEADVSWWVWIFAALAYGLPLWWIVSMAIAGRAPYDRLSGSRVVVAALTR